MWTYLKKLVVSKVVKKYAGSYVRGAMRFVSGALVTYGLADADMAAAFTGSLAEITLNLLDLAINNPEVLTGIVAAAYAQVWSKLALARLLQAC